jgi:hypothetical protein
MVAPEAFQKFISRMDFDMSGKVPPGLAEKVQQMPESGHGACRARVTLRDGK